MTFSSIGGEGVISYEPLIQFEANTWYALNFVTWQTTVAAPFTVYPYAMDPDDETTNLGLSCSPGTQQTGATPSVFECYGNPTMAFEGRLYLRVDFEEAAVEVICFDEISLRTATM